jgi:bifunctional non-homologous end joining protein LigD
VRFPRRLEVARDPRSATAWVAQVDGRELRLSNLEKPYWGPEGYTKGDLVAYYDNIAPWVLPYVRDRPLTMKRMPGGVDAEFFYAKQVPAHAPDWVATAPVTSLDNGKTIDYVLAQERASLLWLANLGCVELHPWHARVDDLAHPDYAFFDLDPMGVGFEEVREVALLVRDACAHLGLRSYPRTSGATGMQVYVPIDRVHSAAAVTAWVGRVCEAINGADPERTTMVWQVADRPPSVFLDHRMNTEGKNIAATYSLRPVRGASLAAPLTWDEVEAGALPGDFTIASIWERLDAVGDLLAPVLRGGQDLTAAMRALGMDPDAHGGPSHAVRAQAPSSTTAPGRVDRAVEVAQQPPATAEPARVGESVGSVEVAEPAGVAGVAGVAGSAVVAPPPVITPMLATSAAAPFDDPEWVFEIKWDGVRAIASVERHAAGGGRTVLRSRNGNDISGGYPELADLWAHVAARNAVLDGEVVAFDAAGAPSFQRLQARMHLRGEADVGRARARAPVTYVVFDLLAVDGALLLDAPLSERLERLDALLRPGPSVRRSDRFVEDGTALYAAAAARGLEGVMGKRLASRYRPGARSQDWRKVKVRRRAAVVLGGWLPGEGGRRGELGALLVGWYDADGVLRYAGRVGTGFDAAERRRLLTRLQSVARAPEHGAGRRASGSVAPFADAPALPAATWVDPALVCEVEYGELTDAGKLRAPSYKGLVDVEPARCHRPA